MDADCDPVEIVDLSAVPYLDQAVIRDKAALRGRMLYLMPFWNGERWNVWLPANNGFIEMHPLDAAEVKYIATAPAQPSDLVIPFVEFMWQRASWPEINHLVAGIIDDFHNLGAAAAKIDYYFAKRDEMGMSVTRLVSTELESLFVTSRSIFDLLQKVLSTLWKSRFRLLDEKAEHRKRNLPDTFSRMVLRGKKDLRISKELEADYGLPPALADSYAAVAPFFLSIRSYRDDLIHHGKAVEIIFQTDKGFCVDPKDPSFSRFHIWSKEHWYNEKVASLRPLIAHIVFRTIDSCNALLNGFAAQLQFPLAMAPGYHVFLNGYHNDALLKLKDIIDGGDAWWV